jgi:hypothetical protein
MDPHDVRAYLERGWTVIEDLDREHWAREFAQRGPDAAMAAGEALREHVRSIRPDWPSDEERRADLAHHIELKLAIDRAAGAFAGLTAR